MLFPGTGDKLQLVTNAAGAVHAHCSYADFPNAGGVPTFGKQNTTISSATTTDILAAPGASTTRKLKFASLRVPAAGVATTVTVVYDASGTDHEIFSCTLQPGEQALYTEQTGWFKVSNTLAPLESSISADVVANAADTYIIGVQCGGRIRTGSFLLFTFKMSKTAAGTAAPAFNVRSGTNGTTGDTARVTHNGVAQTAAADDGMADIIVTFQTVGGAGVLKSAMIFNHRLTTTGLANTAQDQIFSGASAGHDNSGSNYIVGVSVNPGASGVWTFQAASVRGFNLAA